ncbi:MAG: fumarylacetoacetate hydrolase family protein [Candidatus Binataceae bacterium]|nr:fumarylacetoacetate hydrolase family protein [Candidatus Binataceae bacterium]
MKLCTYEIATPLGPVSRIGMETPRGRILDLNAACELTVAERVGKRRAKHLADAIVPADMIGFIDNGPIAREALDHALRHLGATVDDPGLRSLSGGRMVWNRDEIRLLAPLPRPRTIRDCLAFEEHYRNALRDHPVPPVWYELPIYYKGNPNTVQGTDSEVRWPSYCAEKLDYELEFAAIIGCEGVNLSPAQAWKHIFGYTIFNDISARDIQMKEMAALLGPAKGKDMDGGNLLGPFIVTADEWDPRDDHTMEARVNGERWGGGSTKAMHHDFGRIVSYLSTGETIMPGEVIGSGTVGTGCGLEVDKYPQPGDLIELEVHGLGILRTRFVK